MDSTIHNPVQLALLIILVPRVIARVHYLRYPPCCWAVWSPGKSYQSNQGTNSSSKRKARSRPSHWTWNPSRRKSLVTSWDIIIAWRLYYSTTIFCSIYMCCGGWTADLGLLGGTGSPKQYRLMYSWLIGCWGHFSTSSETARSVWAHSSVIKKKCPNTPWCLR